MNMEMMGNLSAAAQKLRENGLKVVSENTDEGTVTLETPKGDEKTYSIDEVIEKREENVPEHIETEITKEGMVVKKMTPEERAEANAAYQDKIS